MSGSTHGERKLRSPAENATARPSDVPSMSGEAGVTAGEAWEGQERRRAGRPRVGRRLWRLLRWYYALKYRPFRRERRPADGRRGLVMLQIDALAYADLRRGLELGYCPTLARLV